MGSRQMKERLCFFKGGYQSTRMKGWPLITHSRCSGHYFVLVFIKKTSASPERALEWKIAKPPSKRNEVFVPVDWRHVIFLWLVKYIIITSLKSLIVLAERECSTNWGDCKPNKSNQIHVNESNSSNMTSQALKWLEMYLPKYNVCADF